MPERAGLFSGFAPLELGLPASPAAFYAHFADKDDLFLTLLEDRNEDNVRALRAQLDDHDWDDHTAFLSWFDRGMAHIGPARQRRARSCASPPKSLACGRAAASR